MCKRWELPYHVYFAASATHILTHTFHIPIICVLRVCYMCLPCSILRAIGLWITRTRSLSLPPALSLDSDILYLSCNNAVLLKRIKHKLEIWWIKSNEGNRFCKWKWCATVFGISLYATQAHAKQKLLLVYFCFVLLIPSHPIPSLPIIAGKHIWMNEMTVRNFFIFIDTLPNLHEMRVYRVLNDRILHAIRANHLYITVYVTEHFTKIEIII